MAPAGGMVPLQALALVFHRRNELPHDKSNKMTCAASEDSDQPRLIRVFAVHMKKHWVISYPWCTQRRLWSNWPDAQADLFSLGAQTILLVWSCGCSFSKSQQLEMMVKMWCSPVHHTMALDCKMLVAAHKKMLWRVKSGWEIELRVSLQFHRYDCKWPVNCNPCSLNFFYPLTFTLVWHS